MDLQAIAQQVQAAMQDLLQAAQLREHAIFIVGCSTSEVGGHCIGTCSNEEIAKTILRTILDQARGLYVAVQCCEHINRALVVERACMEQYHLNQVWVRPWLHAGGAMGMQALEQFSDPVVVEDVRGLAQAGIDIGGTLIGMHLRPVAVPIHTRHRSVGQATLIMARTRPKYIGGPRAHYDDVGNAH